ncbi:MAG: MarR family winged helix-turn-helix transcriptional regulator [Pseudomonadota bacterium]
MPDDGSTKIGDALQRQDDRAVSSLTFNLIVLMNTLTRPFDANFGERHNISLSEWRCIMWLASKPGASGQETADGIGMDRMTVSRNLRQLEAKALAAHIPDPNDRKRKLWSLQTAGWAIYDDLLPSALSRDATITDGLNPQQEAEFIRIVLAAQERLSRTD